MRAQQVSELPSHIGTMGETDICTPKTMAAYFKQENCNTIILPSKNQGQLCQEKYSSFLLFFLFIM